MGVGELRVRGVVGIGRPDGIEPIEGAYVSLSSGETFIAERRTGPDGVYEFHITPGEWVLVARAANCVAMTREIKQGKPAEIVENFTLRAGGPDGR
jgi:hypothetical protein